MAAPGALAQMHIVTESTASGLAARYLTSLEDSQKHWMVYLLVQKEDLRKSRGLAESRLVSLLALGVLKPSEVELEKTVQ